MYLIPAFLLLRPTQEASFDASNVGYANDCATYITSLGNITTRIDAIGADCDGPAGTAAIAVRIESMLEEQDDDICSFNCINPNRDGSWSGYLSSAAKGTIPSDQYCGGWKDSMVCGKSRRRRRSGRRLASKSLVYQ